MSADGFNDKVGLIWSVADLLRGDYKAHEYGQVILPLTVLRSLDCRGDLPGRCRLVGSSLARQDQCQEEVFVVRLNNSTPALPDDEQPTYIAEHWSPAKAG